MYQGGLVTALLDIPVVHTPYSLPIKVYSLEVFSIVTGFASIAISFRIFHSLPKNPSPISSHSPFLSTPHLCTRVSPRQSPTCFVDVPVQDISCKWNRAVCGLSRSAPFTEHMFSRFLHVAASISTSFLFIAK